MTYKVTIGPRGTITIPAKARRAFGLEKNDQMIVEETSEGLLLRPTLNVPIEIYTDARIAEFAEDEEKLGKILKDQTS
jgi:AbrB family looped-hinge helix DNA binding protein